MPNLDAFLGNREKLDPNPSQTRAVQAWNRIQRFPTTITVKRGGVFLPVQTVRIEQNLRVREDEKPAATTGVSIAVVFGIKGHPTIPDTDILPRDRFFIDQESVMFEVITVNIQIGEIQAVCEARFG